MEIKNEFKGHKIQKESHYARLNGNFLTINCHESKNKMYIVAWKEDYLELFSDKRNYKKRGIFLFAENNTVKISGEMERPVFGETANNGNFILGDCRFNPRNKFFFYAFDKDGNNIISSFFSASIHKSHLSTEGKYAVCQLAGSDTRDNNLFVFFNLIDGKIAWKQRQKTGWPESYRIDENNEKIFLCHKNVGEFSYNFNGEFIDLEKWEDESLNHISGYEIYLRAENVFNEAQKSKDKPKILKAFALLKMAIRASGKNDKFTALYYRRIGEIYEFVGQKEKSLPVYKKALAIYPKIGLKRKVSKIERQLTANEKFK